MNYFKSFVKGNEEAQPTGTETVARLCDRISSSTLLEDRRDSVRALKSLSKKFRLEVGSQALPHILQLLRSDASDEDICSYSLETLINLTTVEDDEEGDTIIQSEFAMSFIEKFIDTVENIMLVLEMIERYDFTVRWSAIRLLTSLLRGKPSVVQQTILVQPMGISRIMDLLSENREVIRNEALLALIELTRGNANIQKIVAFENGFEAIFAVINEEGFCDGGVVVEDCLMLLLHLLKNNSSNQQFFKEGTLIQRLSPFFDISPESSWSAQKNANIHLMLKVIRTLVSPSNPSNFLQSCQLAMQQCNLLAKLSDLLMATGVPTDVLTEIINTVSEVLRGSTENQHVFANVMAPWEPPRSALVVLLMSMVNSQQPFFLRCAVLYCFQCFLHKNATGQSQIIDTLLPSSLEPHDVSSGQLLCGGLFAQSDTLSNWLAATALSHALHSNEPAKCQLLRVQLATAPGNTPVTLLRQLTSIIQQTTHLQTRIGLLNLLCCWLSNCPIAISHFLDDESTVPFLLSQLAVSGNDRDLLVNGVCALLLGICILDNDGSITHYSKESLIELVDARVGVENFCDTLGCVSQHDLYAKALQKHQPTSDTPRNLLFDYSFAKLFKALEDKITKTVSNLEDIKKEEEVKAAMKAHDSIITEYKTLIREQDSKVAKLQSKCAKLEKDVQETESLLKDRDSQVQQLKDQYNLMKLTQGDDSSSTMKQIQDLLAENNKKSEELASNAKRIKELENEVEKYVAIANEHSPMQDKIKDDCMENGVSEENESFDLKHYKELEDENKKLTKEVEECQESVRRLTESEVLNTAKIQEQILICDAIRKEQEDLLILLSDQETKLKDYKQKLANLGEEVSDDETDSIGEDEVVDDENSPSDQ
uniref:General vesicular transport factor p115 n=1 Tax=Phallusia mammillata TaxID=59560 RepID=A0A6F9DVU6_9ASCI|nr:general vesicular transport factor p115 [Phallusia mammillata]